MPAKSKRTSTTTPRWTKADSLRAFNDGWSIYTTHSGKRLIQPVNYRFQNTLAAAQHVLLEALYGNSPFHAKALHIITRDHL